MTLTDVETRGAATAGVGAGAVLFTADNALAGQAAVVPRGAAALAIGPLRVAGHALESLGRLEAPTATLVERFDAV